MDRTDLGWSGSSYTYVASDLDLPAADRVAAALAVAVEQDPLLFAEVDVPRGRYRLTDDRSPVERAREVLVADLPPGATGQQVVDLLHDEPLRPDRLRVHVGRHQLAVRFDHGAGDAWSCLRFMVHLQQLALTGERLPLPYDVLAPLRRDLHLGGAVGRRLLTTARALRDRDPSGGTYEPADTRPGAEQAATVTMSSDHGFLARLREERTAQPGRVSVAAVVLRGFRRHVTDMFGEPEPGAEVLYGVRSGSTERAFGNWAAGLWVTSEDDDDPVALSRAITEARETGLPTLGALAARRRIPDVRAGRTMVLAPTGRPRLCLTHLNQGGPQPLLRGIDGRPVLLDSGGCPNGLETLLVATRETHGALDVSLSFFPAAYSRSAIEELVRRFHADPWGHGCRRGSTAA